MVGWTVSFPLILFTKYHNLLLSSVQVKQKKNEQKGIFTASVQKYTEKGEFHGRGVARQFRGCGQRRILVGVGADCAKMDGSGPAHVWQVGGSTRAMLQ